MRTALATEAIAYHDVVFDRDFGHSAKYFSEYAGWPNDDLDARWEALYSRRLAKL